MLNATIFSTFTKRLAGESALQPAIKPAEGVLLHGGIKLMWGVVEVALVTIRCASLAIDVAQHAVGSLHF